MGRRPAGRRRLPATGHQRSHLLRLEEEFGHLGASEVGRLRQLEDENSRLNLVVADLTLDKHMLAEALRKKV